MFTRVALLLLLAAFVAIECNKLDDIFKKLGRRVREDDEDEVLEEEPHMLGSHMMDEIGAPRWVDDCTWDPESCFYETLSERRVTMKKHEDGGKVMRAIADAMSTQNRFHNDSINFLESILEKGMKAEICGTDKKLSRKQYIKYLRQIAAQYKIYPHHDWNSSLLMEENRLSLKMKMDLLQTDSFGMKSILHFNVHMAKRFLNRDKKGVLFAIRHIAQGGSCAEHGTVGYTGKDQAESLAAEMAKLKEHPNARLFLKLFTPPMNQLEDQHVNKLPRYWLNGVLPKTDVFVCHEGVTLPGDYGPTRFRNWYQLFGLLWHPKDKDSIDIQVIDMKEDAIVARVTMKLQMGTQEKVHDWNFKFSAKQHEVEPNVSEWYMERLEVLCTPTVNLKKESLLEFGKMLGRDFLNDLYISKNVSDNNLEFVDKYTRSGLQDFKYSDKSETGEEAKKGYYAERASRNVVKYTKYFFDATQSDPDTITFFTISNTKSGDVEYEEEWKFTVKWEDMMQFYDIEKLHIVQSKEIKAGEYGDKKYDDIKYEIEETVEID